MIKMSEGLQLGLEIVKESEGKRLKAYKNKGEKYNTIGYGHYGADVKDDMEITDKEALRLLYSDYMRSVTELSNIAVDIPLTEYQKGALASFIFNIGITKFMDSSIWKYLREGRYFEASTFFAQYRKSSGVILRGLELRRTKETALFNGYVFKGKLILPKDGKHTPIFTYCEHLNDMSDSND